jgi:hypothetical protein
MQEKACRNHMQKSFKQETVFLGLGQIKYSKAL